MELFYGGNPHTRMTQTLRLHYGPPVPQFLPSLVTSRCFAVVWTSPARAFLLTFGAFFESCGLSAHVKGAATPHRTMKSRPGRNLAVPDHHGSTFFLVALDMRESDVRAQFARPPFSRASELNVWYISYGELSKHREAITRFGNGEKSNPSSIEVAHCDIMT